MYKGYRYNYIKFTKEEESKLVENLKSICEWVEENTKNLKAYIHIEIEGYDLMIFRNEAYIKGFDCNSHLYPRSKNNKDNKMIYERINVGLSVKLIKNWEVIKNDIIYALKSEQEVLDAINNFKL